MAKSTKSSSRNGKNNDVRLSDEESASQNRFAERFIGMAKQAANKVSRGYTGSNYATRMDFPECFSKAMEGLEEVASQDHTKSEKETGRRRGLYASVMHRRIIDLEREEVKYRKSGKKRDVPEPLDIVVRDGLDTPNMRRDTMRSRHNHAHTLTSDEIDGLKEQFRKILTEEQYNAVCALIDYLPQGYQNKEIAAMMGISSGTFDSHLSSARDRIAEHFPELKNEMFKMLRHKNPDDGVTRHF